MMKDVTNEQLTLLTDDQIEDGENQLEVLKKYGPRSAISDLVIASKGRYYEWRSVTVPDDDTLKGRTGEIWTQSAYYCNRNRVDVNVTDFVGRIYCVEGWRCYYAIRPVLLLSSSVFLQISSNRVRGYNGTEEVEYGEYPQYAPDKNIQEQLENEYQNGRLQITGRNYTFDKITFYSDNIRWSDYDGVFQAVTYDEYEYSGKKYIRVRVNSAWDFFDCELSNGELYMTGDYVWIEVLPVKWLIDDRTKMLVSKIGLLSGIRFDNDEKGYNGDFSITEMKKYLDRYMLKDLFQTVTLTRTSVETILGTNDMETTKVKKRIKVKSEK